MENANVCQDTKDSTAFALNVVQLITVCIVQKMESVANAILASSWILKITNAVVKEIRLSKNI